MAEELKQEIEKKEIDNPEEDKEDLEIEEDLDESEEDFK